MPIVIHKYTYLLTIIFGKKKCKSVPYVSCCVALKIKKLLKFEVAENIVHMVIL